MENVVIRQIKSREEREACYDLWTAVFPEKRTFFQERIEYDPACTLNTTWIAEVRGEIAAAVQLFPYFTYMEGTLLKVGGIGNVATLSKYRGMSLTQLILRRQTEWMAANGYDLSLLFTDINSFYQKVGWETQSFKTYTVKKSKLEKEVEAFTEAGYKIETFNTESDLEEIKAIYDEFVQHYFGQMIRSIEYWKGQIKWRKEGKNDFLIARDHEKITAYIRVKEDQEKLYITECCYRAGHEKAVFQLLKSVMAHYSSDLYYTQSVPKSHPLFRLFTRAGAEFFEDTGGMWKIIETERLLYRLRDVFLKRVKDKNRNATILLNSAKEDFVFEISPIMVDIHKAQETVTFDVLHKSSPANLMNMLLYGESSADEQLITLFPERAYLFWKTDSF